MSARDDMRGVSPSPKVTPPGSLIELPPSPPSTGRSAHAPSRSRLAASVRRIQTEPIEGGHIKLSPGDYSTALDYLRDSDPDTWGWLQDKPRLDLVDDGYLLQRMPTPIHEYIAQKLGDAFKEGIKSMKSECEPATKRLIEDIVALGSANVRFTNTWYRSPDQQFKIKSLYFPGVVYEVAYSQSEAGLARAAKDYIRESYGQVQKVVGIKVDCASPCVSLTLWCPSFEAKDGITLVGYETSVDGDQVRDVQGNALPGSLKLQLRDLGPQTDLDRLYPGAELDRTVEITYEDIVGYIREAESEQDTLRDVPAPPINMRKRPRSESSVDDLDSEDERKYKRLETQTNEYSFARDDEYRTG